MAYYALKKDVFDKSKITVVGSPVISDDGIASGFSSSNLIYKDVDLANKSFVIETPVYHYSQTSSADQYIISVGTYNNKLLLQARILVSGKISIGIQNDTTPIVTDANTNAVLGNTYQIKFVLNTTKAEIYLKTNNNDYELVKSAVNNSLYTLNNNRLYIGNAYVRASQPFLGSIDLTKFKIYVDGQLVFQPVKPTYLLERRKEGYDPSKFTIVGSPTITEYGVASGFSGTSYLTYNPFTYSTSLEIYFAVTPNGNGKLDGILGTFEGSTYRGMKLDNTSGNTFRLWLSSDGVNYDICNAKTGNATNLTNNVLNYFRLIWDGTTYKLQHSLDMKIWNDVIVVASSLKINTSYSWIIGGTSKSDRLYGPLINGSINLPSISITVDGKEVFTGAKEVYYAMEK